jgi:hypothetical protein
MLNLKTNIFSFLSLHDTMYATVYKYVENAWGAMNHKINLLVFVIYSIFWTVW